jgi:hypothetical protein
MEQIYVINENRRPWGIEDFSLKSLRMRGNKSPVPPVRSAPRGGVLNPKRVTPLINKSKGIDRKNYF